MGEWWSSTASTRQAARPLQFPSLVLSLFSSRMMFGQVFMNVSTFPGYEEGKVADMSAGIRLLKFLVNAYREYIVVERCHVRIYGDSNLCKFYITYEVKRRSSHVQQL